MGSIPKGITQLGESQTVCLAWLYKCSPRGRLAPQEPFVTKSSRKRSPCGANQYDDEFPIRNATIIRANEKASGVTLKEDESAKGKVTECVSALGLEGFSVLTFLSTRGVTIWVLYGTVPGERLGEIDMSVKMRTTSTWTERPYEASLFPGIGFGLFLRSLGPTGQGTVSGRQFLWGVGLPKGNRGVQRFPRARRRLALECKGRRELDCKTHPSSRDETHIDGKVWHLDVGSSPPGAVVCSKGWAVRPLKRYVSWVQNVVRQFGPYPVWALEH
ncbi:uncharacterized protein DS421_18g609690 [Arachis hypogaea]|nr:uncharacterized protein DS421_18g609690 [Arachis hypogaea]